MIMKSTLKFAALAATLGSAVAAHALVISVASVGGYNVVGTTATFTESVVYQSTNPASGQFTTLTAVYDLVNKTGTATYMNADDSQELVYDFTISGVAINNPFESAAGTWSYVSGKGDYANFATGLGTNTININTTDTSSLWTTKGELVPVPEPASIAVIGVGLLGLLRRRRS